MRKDSSIASGILVGRGTGAVVFDAGRRDGGIGFSAHGLDDEVFGGAVNAAVEGLAHDVFVADD